jgi:hypothetical protein
MELVDDTAGVEAAPVKGLLDDKAPHHLDHLLPRSTTLRDSSLWPCVICVANPTPDENAAVLGSLSNGSALGVKIRLVTMP